MKSALKIFSYFIIGILFLIGLVVVTVSLSQNKIIDTALTKISETLQAPIEVDEVSFTLFKKFPYSTFELSGIRLGLQDSSIAENDSTQNILYINHAFISVKTRPLFDYKFETVKVELEGANFAYQIDSLGKSNIDFLMDGNADESPDTTSTSIPFVDLSELLLKDITIHYANDSDFTAAKLYIPELLIRGQFTPEKYTVQSKGNIEMSNCNVDSTNLYKMKNLTADFSLNYINDTINIEALEILSDGADLNLYGKVFLGHDLYTDLYLKSDGLDLNELIKYAPQELLDENGLENVSGILSFSGTSKGIVNDSTLPYLNFDYAFVDGKLTTTDYPEIKKMGFTGSYTNGNEQSNKTTIVDIRSLHLATKSSSVNVRFSINNLDKPTYQLHTNLNVLLDEFKRFVPDSLAQEVSGRFKTTLSTHGTVPDSIDNDFINSTLNKTSATVNLDHIFIKTDTLEIHDFSGTMNYSPGKIAVKNLSIFVPQEYIHLKNASLNATLTGRLTQANDIGIQIQAFHLESPQGKLWGSGSIDNLEHPSFKLETSALIHLSELKPILPDTLIKDISGDIGARITTTGTIHLDSISEQIMPILLENSEFHFVFKDMNATLTDTLMQIRNFSGKVDFIPDTISISDMEGAAIGIDFALDSTTIANYNNTLIQNKPEKLDIQGNLSIGAIDHHLFDALLSQSENEKSTATEKDEDVAPIDSTLYSMELKGKFAIKSILYDSLFINNLTTYLALPDSTSDLFKTYYREPILVEDISTKFKVSDSLTVVDEFKLTAFGGSINSSIKYMQMVDGTQTINMRNVIDQMNIKQLLYDFNNFGQDEMITHENIRGLFSTDLYSRFVLDHDTLVSEDTRILGTLQLENGGVFDFEPASSMSKYTGIKELDNIEFKTLDSKIFMFKNKMYVPKTHIVSTSMDITAYGMQSLADEYEYHLQIHLSEILFSKSKKLLERQAKSGEKVSDDDVDRKAVKLIYAHIGEKKKTGFDTKKAQKAMERKINTQFTILNLRFIPAMIKFDTGVK